MTTNGGHDQYVNVEKVVKEPKRGVVNSVAEDAILVDEFLPLIEPGLRDDGLKRGTPKALKGLPSVVTLVSVCLCVCLCVCDQATGHSF